MTTKRKLNFREYWDAVGTENIQKIVNELGSSLRYFRALRYGIKKPGREQALKILEAARKHTAPFEPDLELLLAGVPRAGANPARTIAPSAAFVKERAKILEQAEAE